MGNELIERPTGSVEVTPDQVDLIKRTVANGATAEELKLFMYDCQRRGVHPLDKKLYFSKRGGKYTAMVAIDFLRELAHETGECVGISKATFTGAPAKPGFTAEVTVKRLVKGVVAEYTHEARWEEFCPAKGQDHMWVKMPHNQLGKCAEAGAIRKGFSGGRIAGLYIKEEFEQERPEEISSSRAMVAEFPPNTLNKGRLVEIVPASGKEPAKVMIEIEDGILGLDAYSAEQYKPLLGHDIEYIYEKNGKFRVVTEMTLAPTADKKAHAINVQAPGPKPQPKAIAEPEVVEAEFPALDDAGEPPEEAYFEAGRECMGLVVNVMPKESRDGSRKWHILTLACVNGDFKVNAWGKFDFASFDEVLNKQVWFKVWAKEFRGNTEYTLDMLELYNARKPAEE